MTSATAALARSITWTGSKQTFFMARFLVDRDLVEDFYRAYAYFRWIDDIIDVSPHPEDEQIRFISRQSELIDLLYRHEKPEDLSSEEEILADLIFNDREDNSGLQSFIRNMFAIIEFDTYRKGRFISQEELTWYSDTLGKSVTDGLLYFVGNGSPRPENQDKYLAGIAAHITHLLRDTHLDTSDGFINIPEDYLNEHNLTPRDTSNPFYQDWVQMRVKTARKYFEDGKHYLDRLSVLRCKMAGYLYCLRFEAVLDAIERDGYILRPSYNERRRLRTFFKLAWLGISIPYNHFF